MTEHEEKLDLGALRADPDVRDRVIATTMDRVRATPKGWAGAALEGSGRYLLPVLAAAAAVLLIVLLSGRSPSPETTAGVLVAAATDDADPVLQWSFGGDEPDPREVLVRYAETTP